MDDFDDLMQANREFADSFDLGGFDGKAHAGIALVTCMDSRIDPLRMLGLKHGDAKIFRNPGGRITPQALEALVLGVSRSRHSGSGPPYVACWRAIVCLTPAADSRARATRCVSWMPCRTASRMIT